MSRSVGMYWWSPRRDTRLAYRELRRNGPAWARLALDGSYALANFGDELSPFAVEIASGRRVRWVRAQEAELIAVGSIMEFVAKRANREPAVWGTGVRDELAADIAEMLRERLGEVLAVRGDSSRRAMGLGPDTPLGDPGLLSPEIVVASRARAGVVYLPHFRTWTSKEGRRTLAAAKEAGFSIAPPSARATETLKRISSADFVLSSSLHGLIVAHSYGVPAQLVRHTTSRTPEPNFKYMDYLATVGQPFDPLPLEALLDGSRRRLVQEEKRAAAEPIRERAASLAESLVMALSAYFGRAGA